MKALIVSLAFAAWIATAADAPFAFKPNDRIVFIGDALIERDIEYGYLETMLTIRNHDKNLTFRNVGWSGDTVWGESRGVFGSQKDGYNALVRIIRETKPTVAFLNYGMNESFAGPDGVARFEQQYNTLLDDLNKAAPDVRVMLLTPISFQPNNAPEAARNSKVNENLKLYADAVMGIAKQRNLPSLNLFKNDPETSDGMHPTASGYQYLAALILLRLGIEEPSGKFASTKGAYDSVHPVAIQQTSVENLRRLIREKNLQFFNKWRPQNETYLFLFRKHEQGKNAKEIPEFDPVIEAKEKEIAKLAGELAKKL